MGFYRYYKVLEGTVTRRKLDSIRRRITHADRVCSEWTTMRFGDAAKWIPDSDYVGGGLVAVTVGERPRGWELIPSRANTYVPKELNRKDRDIVHHLPRVRSQELYDAIQYPMDIFGTVLGERHVVSNDVHYFKLHKDYVPTSDMIRIKKKEFKSI